MSKTARHKGGVYSNIGFTYTTKSLYTIHGTDGESGKSLFYGTACLNCDQICFFVGDEKGLLVARMWCGEAVL